MNADPPSNGHTRPYEPKRLSGGRWAPGSSGHPGGRFKRPPEVLDTLLRNASPKLLRKAISMAMGGDSVVMRALLDRLVPLARGRLITLPQPVPATPLEAIDVVIAAVATGAITPDEGVRLGALFASRAQIAELPALQERLDRLEALLAGQPKAVIDALGLEP